MSPNFSIVLNCFASPPTWLNGQRLVGDLLKQACAHTHAPTHALRRTAHNVSPVSEVLAAIYLQDEGGRSTGYNTQVNG